MSAAGGKRGPGLVLALAAVLAVGAVAAAPLSVTKSVGMARAEDDISLAAANHDMVLVKVQPIDSAMVKQGFDNPRVRVLFIGNETAVRWAEEAEPRLLNLLPLRLSLIERDGAVTVLSDDFDAWMREFPDDPANLTLRAWRAELASILEDFLLQ